MNQSKVTRVIAIKNFLSDFTIKDLADLYNGDMECQVNVAQDGGERIEGDYKGRAWHGWSDGIEKWKSFRIPYKANTKPEYDINTIMSFDLSNHAEGIGMTGWDWKNKLSRWVAFDFDSLIGHADGLSTQEMDDVVMKASEIDWVTTRKSTSGGGIHLYVHMVPVPTENHTEHAALARSILGQMSALTGFDFQTKVDGCGGNIWVWHRKLKDTDGLTMIKEGTILKEPPSNWKDHLSVIRGKRKKNLPQFIQDDTDALTDAEKTFLELTGQRATVQLDEGHKKLIKYFKDQKAMWWWDNDHHMLVTHTFWLSKAYDELAMVGVFKTNSEGKDLNTQNCFLFPMRKSAWVVRRFTPGVQESDSWDQDGGGWTRCYLNRQPDLPIASRTYAGIEQEKGGFVFAQAEMAIKAAATLGTHVTLPNWISQRKTTLKRHKDGRLIVEIKKEDTDRADDMQGWLADKKGTWKRIFSTQVKDVSEQETSTYDDFIRHMITATGDDYGWVIKTNKLWRSEPLPHIKLSLKSMGFNPKDADNILGNSVLKCWTIVNRPFQNEYPGNREWNRAAAQIKFEPSDFSESLRYPTWTKVLEHCGEGLDDSIKKNAWCTSNGIVCGADYLKCWVSSIFQEPLEPLPYLFLYGPQNSGKSVLHEALSLLLTRGYTRADHAIENQQGFNGELENAIICVIEEVNLSQSKTAYNRIKDWVTSRHINIRKLYHSPYHVPNTTHWIQCANDASYCPIFAGDTRITMCFVDVLKDLIPKRDLIERLKKEAPDFVASLLHLEIPRSIDRLNLPVINTGEKETLQTNNETSLETFIREKVFYTAGNMVTVKEFYANFINWLDPDEAHNWSKIRMGKELPSNIPKGRRQEDGHFCIGNVAFEPTESTMPKLILENGSLRYRNDGS